jgi:type I restriction enzyme S subunit
MSEWKTYKVKELVELGIIERPMDGNHGEIHPKSSDFVPEGIPFIMATDIKNNKVDLKNCSFITKVQADKLRKGFSIAGDVLLTHKASIGRTAIVPTLKTQYIMLTPQVTFYRIVDTKRLNNEFLKHYFNSSIFQQIINSYANSGSTRAYIGITEQLSLPILLPPIDNQILIASILSSLDHKIELNLQMNQTLEAIALAIFKEWFVNFNLPGFDGELVDGLPKGWKLSKLSEIISKVVDNRGKTPPITEGAKEGIPLIEVNALINSPIVVQQHLAKKFVDEETYENWFRKGHPIKGDVLFSTVGSIGEIAISFGEKICIAQNIIALRSNFSGSFLYFTLKSIRQNLLSLDISSVQPSIKVPHLLNYEIIVPNEAEINVFENTIAPFLERIFKNEMEIRILTQIRDCILPKLMTGKIEINK